MTLFKNSFTNKFDRDCAFEYIDSDKSILQRENEKQSLSSSAGIN